MESGVASLLDDLMGQIIQGSSEAEDDLLLARYRELDTRMHMVRLMASQLYDRRHDASQQPSNAKTTSSGTTNGPSHPSEAVPSTRTNASSTTNIVHPNVSLDSGDSNKTPGAHNELREQLNGMVATSDLNNRYGIAAAAAAVAASTPITTNDVQRAPSQHDIILAHLCATFLSQNPQSQASLAPMLGRNDSALAAAAMLSMAASFDPQSCPLLRNNPLFNGNQNVRRSDRLVEEMFQIILQNSDSVASIGPQLGVVVPNVISTDHAAVMGLEMVNDYLAAQDGLPFNSQQQNQTRPPLQCPQCQTFITPMWFPLNGSHLCTSCAHSVLWSVVEPSISTLFQRYLTVSDENDDLPNPTVTESAGSSHYAAPSVLTNTQLRSGSQRTQSGQQINTNSLNQAAAAAAALPYQHQLAAAIAAMSAVANAATVQQAAIAASANNSSSNNNNSSRTSAQTTTTNSNTLVNGHHQQQQSQGHQNAAAAIAAQQLQALMPQLFQYFSPMVQLQPQRSGATDHQPSTQSTSLNLLNGIFNLHNFQQVVNQLTSSSTGAPSANNNNQTNNGRTLVNGVVHSNNNAAGGGTDHHQQEQIATPTAATITTSTNTQHLVNGVVSTGTGGSQSRTTAAASNAGSSSTQRQQQQQQRAPRQESRRGRS